MNNIGHLHPIFQHHQQQMNLMRGGGQMGARPQMTRPQMSQQQAYSQDPYYQAAYGGGRVPAQNPHPGYQNNAAANMQYAANSKIMEQQHAAYAGHGAYGTAAAARAPQPQVSPGSSWHTPQGANQASVAPTAQSSSQALSDNSFKV